MVIFHSYVSLPEGMCGLSNTYVGCTSKRSRSHTTHIRIPERKPPKCKANCRFTLKTSFLMGFQTYFGFLKRSNHSNIFKTAKLKSHYEKQPFTTDPLSTPFLPSKSAMASSSPSCKGPSHQVLGMTRRHRSLLLRKESKGLLQAGKKVNITWLNHLISSHVMFSLRGVPKCVHLPVQTLGVLSVNRCGCPARIQFLMYGKLVADFWCTTMKLHMWFQPEANPNLRTSK